IQTVVVPPHSGLASAYGLLTAGFRREFSRTHLVDVAAFNDAGLEVIRAELREIGRDALLRDGIEVNDAIYSFSADMRYAGQGFEVCVDFPRDIDANLAQIVGHF